MKNGIFAAIAALALSQFAGSAHAGVVWDNGGPASLNLGGSQMSDTVQAEDFQIFGVNALSGITFWSVENVPADYLGSIDWAIRSDAAGTPGSVVDSGNAA